MELKEYQQKTLDQVKNYLTLLDEWKKRTNDNPELEIDFPAKAWGKAQIPRSYIPRKNGIGNPLPNYCLKIPTGGGKTFLAIKAIDLINQIYLKKKTGMILWIVPTTQIYRQTLKNLKDKAHPYRQHLDISSGNKTLILEKTDRFTPQDLEENLVVLMLMLPAANRQTKESLKVFRDNGFSDFFPPEDDREGQAIILQKIPNLDTFEDKDGFWGRQIKTSLGNTLRVCQPIIILDEGQKAYSDLVQETLRGFNPSMIVELSATPLEKSNILVEIFGVELNNEEMIKLDLHVINKADVGWKETLLEAIGKRESLEKKANENESNSNRYIRPICVIQVERTGKDQRTGSYIHSEDVKDFLLKIKGIPADEVAIKTSDKDELKEIDDIGGLLSKGCKIRYIITKQALQEGWDCPFAYVLAILTNPTSQNALTQLVGRILRQPYAKKTGVKELDESYVFCFQQRADGILSKIKQGFEMEGLGDLHKNIIIGDNLDDESTDKIISIREKFKNVAKNVILPVFVIKEQGGWRRVDYDIDLVPKIKWESINLDPIIDLKLGKQNEVGVESIINIIDDRQQLIERKEVKMLREKGLEVDIVFLSRYLGDIIPNPWVAYEMGKQILSELKKKNNADIIVKNFIYIVEELRKYLSKERDRLAKDIFQKLLDEKAIRFLIIGKGLGYKLPEKLRIKPSDISLVKNYNESLQRSLFDAPPVGDMNEVEKSIAYYLDGQDKLLFWYRNQSKNDYYIQAWKKQKVYPDFIFTTSKNKKDIDKVFVMELKGQYLLGSEDSVYKQTLLNMCSELAKEKDFSELGLMFKDKEITFQFVEELSWRQELDKMMKK